MTKLFSLSHSFNNELTLQKTAIEGLESLLHGGALRADATTLVKYLLDRAHSAEAALSRLVGHQLSSKRIQNLFFEPSIHDTIEPRESQPDFNDGLIASRAMIIAESGLFDEDYYKSQTGDEIGTGYDAIKHFLLNGWILARDPNPLFSVRFYLYKYADVRTSGVDPLTHYIENGSKELRDPHPLFLSSYYASKVAENKSENHTWLRHFLADLPSTISPHPLFDVGEYARRARINTTSAPEALLHYVHSGWKQGISPSPLFHVRYYRLQTRWVHTDVEPYTHYVMFGIDNGINPHPLFDARRYRSATREDDDYHDPLVSYCLLTSPDEVITSEFFDPTYYALTSGVNANGRSMLWRYSSDGADNTHAPNRFFDPASYRAEFMPGIDFQGGVGPLDHLLLSQEEGSDGNKFLWLLNSLLDNQAAAATGGAPLEVHRTVVAAGEPSQIRDYRGKLTHKEGRPNILLVAHLAGDRLFGSERSLLDMLDGLGSLDVNVYVTLPRNVPEYTNMIRRGCAHVFVFKYGWWKHAQPSAPEVRGRFRTLMTDYNIRAVHVNTIMLRECLEAAADCNVTRIVHARELIGSDPGLCDLIGLSSDEIIREVLGRTDWLIGNSATTAQAFASSSKTLVIPNTIDVDAIDIAHEVVPGRIKFGLISSNVPKKGLADLVELARACVAQVPAAEFVIIGPETKALEALRSGSVEAELPANIRFAGYAETPRDAVAQVNVVLSLSYFAESFGRTVLEAMAAGRPVIVYEWGALPELVRHGETGFLVPYRQPAEAVRYVERLCDDPRLLAEMGAKAQRFAQERYGLAAYREAFRNAYSRILPDVVFPRPKRTHPLVRPARLPGLKSREPRIRVAYFCWHFPVPSETFVLNELRVLVQAGVDVIAFCKQIPHKDFKPDFPIQFERVDSAATLARRLRETGRTVVHAHFAYPTVTDMVWPACEEAEIPFTFIAHAQDIFVHANAERNRLADIGASRWCLKLFTLSRYHYDYIAARGFPTRKLMINPNAVNLAQFAPPDDSGTAAWAAPRPRTNRILSVHRFVEKKGLINLVKAGALLGDTDLRIDIFGYGALEAEYKQTVASLDIANVAIHGALTQPEVHAALATADLFVCPSVRTATGDMDGIPTSLIESMAAGVPVLATAIAGIPDLVEDGVTGFICEPTPDSIAEAIRRFYSLHPLQVAAIVVEARKRVVERHDPARLVGNLRRVWENVTIDIVVVAWNNLRELRLVVDAILANTATPYHLIVCDNMSQKEDVADYLDALWEAEERVTVIHNNRNAMVGPGTNAALAEGVSDIAIYMCGKEGISFANGWETAFLPAFDDPEVGLVGTIGTSPTYLTGSLYPAGIPAFGRFRNQDFAARNPDRPFGHVQGGLFAMRRRMIDDIGGFSEAVPHDYTDVEYSYYAESRGWKLAEADGVLALFNKSRPTLSQRFHDGLKVAHPVLEPQIANFQGVVDGRLRHCNICDWYGEAFAAESCCPECGAGPMDRTLYRWLSESTLMYRRLPALSAGLTGKMATVWAEQFQGPRMTVAELTAELEKNGRLPNAPGRMHVAALRITPAECAESQVLARELRRLVMPGGKVLIQVELGPMEEWSGGYASLGESLTRERFVGEPAVRYASRAVGYGYAPTAVFARV